MLIFLFQNVFIFYADPYPPVLLLLLLFVLLLLLLLFLLGRRPLTSLLHLATFDFPKCQNKLEMIGPL